MMTLSRTDTILRDIRNATLCFEAGIDKLKGIECLALAYDLIAEIDNNNSDAQVLSFCENLRCTHTRLVLDKVFPYLHSQTYPSIQFVAFWYQAAVILDENSPADNSVGEIKQGLERLADDELNRRSEVVAVGWVYDCSLLNGFIRSQALSRELLDEAEKKYKFRGQYSLEALAKLKDANIYSIQNSLKKYPREKRERILTAPAVQELSKKLRREPMDRLAEHWMIY